MVGAAIRFSVGYRGCLTACLLFGAILVACSPQAAAPATTPGPAWQGIVPGVSTEEEVLQIMDEPARVTRQGEYTSYEFQSPVGGMSRMDEVMLWDGRVRLIRIQVCDNNLKLILVRHGEPEAVTWSYAHSYTRLFIYARQGVAVAAQINLPPAESNIFERWYFEPMSLERFREELAPLRVPQQRPNPEDKASEDYWPREP